MQHEPPGRGLGRAEVQAHPRWSGGAAMKGKTMDHEIMEAAWAESQPDQDGESRFWFDNHGPGNFEGVLIAWQPPAPTTSL